MKIYKFIFLFAMTIMASIAQAAKTGTVTFRIDSALVQANLGAKDVSVGDRVAIYKRTCVGGRTQTCTKDRIGGGSVARVLDERYSEIKLDSGVHVGEGFLIERE